MKSVAVAALALLESVSAFQAPAMRSPTKASAVTIGGGRFRFRNPPAFSSLRIEGHAARDAAKRLRAIFELRDASEEGGLVVGK